VDSVTGWAYTYDSNGNMTCRDSTGTDVFDYAYDSENRLVQAKENGVVIATMTYDGDGNRVITVAGVYQCSFSLRFDTRRQL
jgi:YD repeat-containing protein